MRRGMDEVFEWIGKVGTGLAAVLSVVKAVDVFRKGRAKRRRDEAAVLGRISPLLPRLEEAALARVRDWDVRIDGLQERQQTHLVDLHDEVMRYARELPKGAAAGAVEEAARICVAVGAAAREDTDKALVEHEIRAGVAQAAQAVEARIDGYARARRRRNAPCPQLLGVRLAALVEVVAGHPAVVESLDAAGPSRRSRLGAESDQAALFTGPERS